MRRPFSIRWNQARTSGWMRGEKGKNGGTPAESSSNLACNSSRSEISFSTRMRFITRTISCVPLSGSTVASPCTRQPVPFMLIWRAKQFGLIQSGLLVVMLSGSCTGCSSQRHIARHRPSRPSDANQSRHRRFTDARRSTLLPVQWERISTSRSCGNSAGHEEGSIWVER